MWDVGSNMRKIIINIIKGEFKMKKTTLIYVAVALMISTNLFAQRTTDIEGGKDYTSISRFEGAVIEFYKETKWGSYKLPVSEQGTIDWGKPNILEGKVTRIQYTVSKDNNSEFVLHNYKAAFKKSGYEILIAIANEELGVSGRPHQWTEMYYVAGGYYNGIGNEKFGLNFQWPTWNNNQCFIAASGHEKDKDIYVIIYAIVDAKYTLITQDVIEVEVVETGLVTAQSIDKGLAADGYTTLDGVYFNTGKSSIKPESVDALGIIAEYLNTHTEKKFFIVGHTDNVGDFDTNLKLSKDRAETVVNELVTKYSVKTEQLKAFGSGSTGPVVSNSTDEGKAKNRRVEIVEQ